MVQIMLHCNSINRKQFVFWAILSFFLSLFSVLGVADPQDKENNTLYKTSYALIIGIENYNNWPSPGKAVYDAVLVGNELKKLSFNVIHRTDLDSSELEKALKTFFYNEKIDNESRLFIWYSGHGQAIDGEGFLVPSDAPLAYAPDFKMKAFPVRRFDELSKLTKAKYVYMVFDACLSSQIFVNESVDSSEIPIASVLKYPARQYFCSCTSGPQLQGNSAFRDIFIEVLQNEVKANANGDNYLTASEIGSFIKKKMAGTTLGKKQEPQNGRLKDSDKGEFVFLLQDKSFDYFRDNLSDESKGPEMIKIPDSFFMMGDLQGGGFNDEKPVHRVNLSGIAVSRYEATFYEYDRFCDTIGRKKPDDNGWGRGNRPVINVSWEDAVMYTEWLSKQTGFTYRLPTEAEWEHFARAGADTNYWWGNEIGRGNASCYGCSAQWGWDAERKTAPVGSFIPNPFGIYDTVGNVWEWTCSEYTDEYNGKETRCLDKITNGGEAVVRRGGSWDEEPKKCRVSHRKVGYPSERSPYIGFRVVRELKYGG